MIRVFNVEARGLRVGDVSGSSDPFAVFTLGSWRKQTKAISSTLEPVWMDADYRLEEASLDFSKHYVLNIEVRDKVRGCMRGAEARVEPWGPMC